MRNWNRKQVIVYIRRLVLLSQSGEKAYIVNQIIYLLFFISVQQYLTLHITKPARNNLLISGLL